MTTDNLLPPNQTALEAGLSEVQARLNELPVTVRQLWDAEHCPEDCLPWLAWALSVDAWDTYWPAHVKRQVILASAQVCRAAPDALRPS